MPIAETPLLPGAPTTPLAPATTRRNIACSAVNSFFVEGAMTLSEGNMVLTLFVKALGGSNALVGLLPSLRFFGWLAPQFLAAGSLQRLTRFVPAVRNLEIVRALCYLIIALAAFWGGLTQPGWTLLLFMVLYMLTRVMAGASAVARAEIIARMVPAAERSTVISVRQFAGGIAGFLAGFAVRYILDDKVSRFPTNYATLIGLSALSFGLAIISLSLIKEPRVAVTPRQVHWWQQLQRAPALLRGDRRYRLYIIMRAAATGIELAGPFYILYATEVLGAPAAIAGVYISLRTFALIFSNMFWGLQCRRRGNLWVLRMAFLLGGLAPLVALGLPWGLAVLWGDNIPTYAMWFFGLVFVIQGLSNSAAGIGEMAYLYDISPEHDRLTYYGFTNTILGFFYFLPAIGGALLDRIGYAPIFAAAAALLGLALGLAWRLGHYERPPSACAPDGVEGA
jgi:MFS family permease